MDIQVVYSILIQGPSASGKKERESANWSRKHMTNEGLLLSLINAAYFLLKISLHEEYKQHSDKVSQLRSMNKVQMPFLPSLMR